MEQIIKVPDIGSSSAVDVIEILVKPGDKIEIDTPLITLESDKASMEIPSPEAGVVKSITVKIGDKVNMGDAILTLSADNEIKEESITPPASSGTTSVEEVRIPDIGSTALVDVIEVFVKAGDEIDIDTPLITLESDKASMEIPSPLKGMIQELKLKVGDKVKTGDLILLLATSSEVPKPVDNSTKVSEPTKVVTPMVSEKVEPTVADNEKQDLFLLAGPAVRRMARSLGVNLSEIKGSGRKARITVEDVESYVKARLQQPQTTVSHTGLQLPVAESFDFSVFGEIETKSLSKIKRLSGNNLHKAWLQIPHVTQFDKADITDLEAFRKEQSSLLEKEGIKLTILAFMTKAVSRALLEFPEFNSSLSSDGQSLIIKKYINIGIAVDTPQGLVVPVIRNADKLSIRELALKMAELSLKARQKALTPADMSGGTFTISSLGGIGGTAFTPIVNHPEVAILGVSKSNIEPVFEHDQFVPRLMLPLSLSYDHRVIDGAQGARFTKFLSSLLSDIRKIML